MIETNGRLQNHAAEEQPLVANRKSSRLDSARSIDYESVVWSSFENFNCYIITILYQLTVVFASKSDCCLLTSCFFTIINYVWSFKSSSNLQICIFLFYTRLFLICKIFEHLFMTGVGNLRPTKAFYPSRDLFSFFNDRYAAINRRNDSHLLAKTFFCGLRDRFVRKKAWISGEDLFWSLPSIRAKKGLNCWRRPFSFGLLE